MERRHGDEKVEILVTGVRGEDQNKGNQAAMDIEQDSLRKQEENEDKEKEEGKEEKHEKDRGEEGSGDESDDDDDDQPTAAPLHPAGLKQFSIPWLQ